MKSRTFSDNSTHESSTVLAWTIHLFPHLGTLFWSWKIKSFYYIGQLRYAKRTDSLRLTVTESLDRGGASNFAISQTNPIANWLPGGLRLCGIAYNNQTLALQIVISQMSVWDAIWANYGHCRCRQFSMHFALMRFDVPVWMNDGHIPVIDGS